MAYYDYFLSTTRSRRYQWIVDLYSCKILEKTINHGLGSSPQILLEIGLGQGDMIPRFRNIKNITAFGMDLNLGICAALNTQPGTTLQAKLPLLPLTKNSLDWIYMSHVIEHLGNYAAALQFLAQARQTLKVSGKIAVLFPDYLSWQEDFADVDYSHDFPMTLRRMQSLARDEGFQVEAAYDYTGGWFGWSGRLFGFVGRLLPLRTLHALAPLRLQTLRKARYTFHRNWLVILSLAQKQNP